MDDAAATEDAPMAAVEDVPTAAVEDAPMAAVKDPTDAEAKPDGGEEQPPQKLDKLKLFLIPETGEAYMMAPPLPLEVATQSRSGRSMRPIRRDIDDAPLVEWNASIVGQRARVLVGEHKWAEAVITAYASNGFEKHNFTTSVQAKISNRVYCNVCTLDPQLPPSHSVLGAGLQEH